MQVWKLAKPESTRYRADWAPEMEYIPLPCPLEPERHRGVNSRRSDPLSILLTEPKEISALTWTWGPGELVVREDVLEVLQGHKVTGFEVAPVRASYVQRIEDDDEADEQIINNLIDDALASAPEIPKLWEIKVTGWGGVAPEESGTRLEKHCPGCGYRHYSDITHPEKLFDNSQWDGSDFFMIWPLPAYFFITDRVAEVIRRHKWERCRLIPIEELTFAGSGFSPGGLRSSMPEDRARAIGEPLGIY